MSINESYDSINQDDNDLPSADKVLEYIENNKKIQEKRRQESSNRYHAKMDEFKEDFYDNLSKHIDVVVPADDIKIEGYNASLLEAVIGVSKKNNWCLQVKKSGKDITIGRMDNSLVIKMLNDVIGFSKLTFSKFSFKFTNHDDIISKIMLNNIYMLLTSKGWLVDPPGFQLHIRHQNDTKHDYKKYIELELYDSGLKESIFGSKPYRVIRRDWNV